MKRIEILAEVIGKPRLVDIDTGQLIVLEKKALEAMKIAMKQSFEAAKKKYWATRHDIDVYNDFDEYINELEGCKDE